MSMQAPFDYDAAFGRNIGLVSGTEQRMLRSARVALPGLGGVGSAHMQTLARMGIEAFHLADPDHFEAANTHRQLSATRRNMGRSKTEVAAETVLDINPDASVRAFPEGITVANVGAFLSGVDVVVDGLDFFRIKVRRMLYDRCRARGIPVVNAGPVGYGAAVLVFLPKGPTFEAFFGIEEGMTRAEQLLAFGAGLGPGLSSQIDATRFDFEAERGPALISACILCAATAATEVLKLVTGRGEVLAAPNGMYFDPFNNRTTALRRTSALRGHEKGRRNLAEAFRRFPTLRRMHERELAEREMTRSKAGARTHRAVPQALHAGG